MPKFTWQEGQKRLPLIGCILLLIALVVSLIILCEFHGGSRGGLWPWQAGVGSPDGGAARGVLSGERTLAGYRAPRRRSCKWPWTTGPAGPFEDTG